MSDISEPTTWLRSTVQRLAALGEWEQRSILFATLIQKQPAENGSTIFSRLLAAAFVRRALAEKVAVDSAQLAALCDLWPAEHRARVREAAAGAGDRLTLSFLPSGVEWLTETPEDDQLPIPDYGGDRPLTLGERRTLALKPNRAIIERAMLDPHPMVAIKLLSNSRLTEEDALSMAARRPGSPAILAEIALHPRWRRRRRIALALVYNPALPIWHGLSLLHFLDAPEASAVAADARLAPETRSGAKELLNISTEDTQLW